MANKLGVLYTRKVNGKKKTTRITRTQFLKVMERCQKIREFERLEQNLAIVNEEMGT